jgi:hypothetical protein
VHQWDGGRKAPAFGRGSSDSSDFFTSIKEKEFIMLRRTLNEFVTSESGYVSPRTGLPVAWVVGLLLAAAVVLAPDPAEAACEEGYITVEDCIDNEQSCAQRCDEGKHCSSYTCSVYDDDLCYCY